MRFLHEMAYDAAPDAVFEMLATPEFRERVCAFQRVLRHSITIEEDDEGNLVVDIDQVQSADPIPSSVRKFVGNEIEIEQREVWHSSTEAALTVTIPGKPGRMDGSIRLVARDGGTVETVTGEILVSIPFFGAKVEEMVGQVFRWALEAESEVGDEWLAEE